MSKNERGFIPHHFWLKNGAGFTLIELLVAMVITVLLVAALFSVFNLAGRAWQKGEARTQRYQNLRQALDRMSEEIRSAILLNPDYNPGKDLRFYGEDEWVHTNPGAQCNGDRLSFISVSHPPDGWDYGSDWSNPANPKLKFDCLELTYYILDSVTDAYPLVNGERQLRLMRRYQSSRLPDGSITGGGTYNQLAEHICRMEFTYYEADGTSHYTWDSDSTGKLPTKVKIKLTAQADLAREQKEEIFTTEVWLANANFQ